MKKKLLALVLAAGMVASMAACGNTNNGGSASADSKNTSAAAESTDSDLAYIKDKGTLVVGITDFEPMDYQDDSGNWIGFDADLASAFAESLGVNVEFVEIDWDNKILELNSKKIDCAWNGMTLTDEVKSSMNCTEPYVKNEQIVVMKADVVNNYKQSSDLANVTFAAESGSAGEAAIQDLGFGAKLTSVSAQSDALMEVESGSVQACVIDNTMANAMTGAGTSYADLAQGISLTSEEYGMGFRKDSDVTAEVNKIIQEMKADGSLQKLADKYNLTLA